MKTAGRLTAGYNRRKWSIWRTLVRQRYLYLLFIPGALYFLIFRYAPMVGIVIGFEKYNIFDGIVGSKWVGLENFIKFFQNRNCWSYVWNTLVLNIYLLIFGFPAPIILAMLINEIRWSPYQKFVQTVSYLPHFITAVIIVGIFSDLFSRSGALGNMLNTLMKTDTIYMQEPSWFRSIYVLMDIWRSVGWGTILYLAALAGVDVQLYEAAMIDGASKIQRILHIKLPSIMYTIVIVLILRMGSMMNVGFESVYLLQNDLTLETSEVLSTFVYKRGIVSANYSYGAAVGFFNSVVNTVLIVSVNKIADRVAGSSLW